MKFFLLIMMISSSVHMLYESYLNLLFMRKYWHANVGRIMTKLAQRHSVCTSYRASYPTLLIYDEICLLSWMHYDL
jgi:hypothetical protein